MGQGVESGMTSHTERWNALSRHIASWTFIANSVLTLRVAPGECEPGFFISSRAETVGFRHLPETSSLLQLDGRLVCCPFVPLPGQDCTNPELRRYQPLVHGRPSPGSGCHAKFPTVVR